VPEFGQKVSLLWTPSAGATSYNVYYATSAGVTKANGTKISGILTNSYTHSKLADGSPLKEGTTYYYAVTAVDGNGQESVLSSEVTGTPLAAPKVRGLDTQILTPH
jgi:fibronectin type 3 domain-containing protein